MRIFQQIHHDREPRIADFALCVRSVRGPVRSPGLGVGTVGWDVYGPGPHFFSLMDFTWIVVGLACWALALVFVLLLMRMAGQQDRGARHSEKTLDPSSDVTITQVGNTKSTTARASTPAKERPAKAPTTEVQAPAKPEDPR